MAAERETISLIGSDKVQGTAVYGADGEKNRGNRARNDRKG